MALPQAKMRIPKTARAMVRPDRTQRARMQAIMIWFRFALRYCSGFTVAETSGGELPFVGNSLPFVASVRGADGTAEGGPPLLRTAADAGQLAPVPLTLRSFRTRVMEDAKGRGAGGIAGAKENDHCRFLLCELRDRDYSIGNRGADAYT